MQPLSAWSREWVCTKFRVRISTGGRRGPAAIMSPSSLMDGSRLVSLVSDPGEPTEYRWIFP